MSLPQIFLTAGFRAAVFTAAGAGTALANLPVKHSREFGQRYECDVTPTLAGWTQDAGNAGAAPVTANGWMRFATSQTEVLGFTQGQAPWARTANEAYTLEVCYRTPVRGQFVIAAGPAGNAREVLIISPAALQLGTGAVSQGIAVNRTNAQHTVRIGVWPGATSRTVQVWQDGRTVYGPAAGGTLTAAPETISFGETSATAECELDVDHVRLEKGGAFAPAIPVLSVSHSPTAAALTWTTVPGVSYQLQWSSNPANWNDLGPPLAAMGAVGSATDAIGGVSTRFYRVRENGTGSLGQAWSPGAAPVVTNLPALVETVNPTALARISPASGPGYEDYPINGETEQDQYRSYARREVLQAIKYATARVEFMTIHWPFGNRRPLGLGDMSEANGAIPGTRDGIPAHPAGTHTNGRDIDVAYYQLDQPDNRLRAMCSHVVGGVDQNHCTSPPTILDVWRTALFAGSLMQHSRLRVIGVDGQAGPQIAEAIRQLIDAGWLPETVRPVISQRLVYETADGGLGWYYFHHRHMHVSFRD